MIPESKKQEESPSLLRFIARKNLVNTVGFIIATGTNNDNHLVGEGRVRGKTWKIQYATRVSHDTDGLDSTPET